VNDNQIIQRFRKMIGAEFYWEGCRCVLVDVLVEEAELILECAGSETAIQPDQYGRPSRRSQAVRQVSIFDDQGGYSPEVMELLEMKSSPRQP